MLSPKIALLLLICSFVVVGLTYADYRLQQQHQQRIRPRNTQQLHKGTVNSKRRMVPQAPDTNTDTQQSTPDHGNYEDYEAVDENPSTQRPLAAYNRDNKRPNH